MECGSFQIRIGGGQSRGWASDYLTLFTKNERIKKNGDTLSSHLELQPFSSSSSSLLSSAKEESLQHSLSAPVTPPDSIERVWPMERLLSSSSSSSLLPSRVLSKLHSPFLSRHGRVDSPKLPPARTDSRRGGSVSCVHEGPDLGSLSPMDKPPPLWTRRVDSTPESVPTPQFHRQNAMGDSWQRKVLNSNHSKFDI